MILDASVPQAILSLPKSPWTSIPATPTPRPPDLTLDGSHHQTLRGWGGCFNELGWTALQTLSSPDQEAILRALFSSHPAEGCGFTWCRIPIGANDYSLDWYSHADTPGDYPMAHHSIARDRKHLVPYFQAARKYAGDALRLFASPWSPPAWMKERAVYNGSTLTWDPRTRSAYALYLLKSIRSLRAEGLPIDQLHVQNEPGSDQKFPSCIWTGAKLAAFIRDDLGPLFFKENETCEIWLGTMEKGIEHGYEPAHIGLRNYAYWIHPALADPECSRFIRGIGLQWDGKGLLPKLHACHPDLPLMQTESECGDGTNTWEHMLYTADLAWHYFYHGAIAHICWNMVLAVGGTSTWGWTQNSLFSIDTAHGTYHANPEFYLYRHLSLARPGAVRLGLRGAWSGFALAFQNPGGSLALTLWNPTPQARTLAIQARNKCWEIQLPASGLASLLLPPS